MPYDTRFLIRYVLIICGLLIIVGMLFAKGCSHKKTVKHVQTEHEMAKTQIITEYNKKLSILNNDIIESESEEKRKLIIKAISSIAPNIDDMIISDNGLVYIVHCISTTEVIAIINHNGMSDYFFYSSFIGTGKRCNKQSKNSRHHLAKMASKSTK